MSFYLLLILILLPGLSRVARAAVGGTISGTVKDPTGAVIQNATVTVTNTDTGVRQVVATNVTGSYSLPDLPVGHYDLDITVTGFRPYRRAGIAIDVDNPADLRQLITEPGETRAQRLAREWKIDLRATGSDGV